MNARPYQSADLPGIVETYTVSIRVSAASFYSPEQIEAWAPVPTNLDRWRERLAQRHTIVAETDGALAGFVSYTSDGYLDFLSTHPTFARRGVASKLYQCVESTLIAAGVPKVTAHVSLAARRFFEHHGFQVDAEEEIECRGVFLRRFGMHKDLADKRVAEPTRCSERGVMLKRSTGSRWRGSSSAMQTIGKLPLSSRSPTRDPGKSSFVSRIWSGSRRVPIRPAAPFRMLMMIGRWIRCQHPVPAAVGELCDLGRSDY
jgi:putative acetyltransferase